MKRHPPALSRRQFVAALGSGLLLPEHGVLAPRWGLPADDVSPPVPISLPRDDGPHDALTEWWYYTGQLIAAEGARFGFEQVTFKGTRGRLAGQISHVAITDDVRRRFRYDQRAMVDDGSVVQPAVGFDLEIGDWSMRGAGGDDALAMAIPGYAYALELTSRKPPVLHGSDGYIRSDSGAESYYYSRTRQAVTGTLVADGVETAVTGDGWMDHQWGDFTSFSDGGWDWFSIQLDDETELMIFQFRDRAGARSLLVATFVDPAGTSVDLAPAEVAVDATATWVSPHSGATYPVAWNVRVEGQSLTLTVSPVLEDQELDSRQTTGLTYWEGQVEVTGSRAGTPVRGRGYVELTGYTRERDGAVP